MSARTESSSEPAPIEISQTTTASRVSRFAHAMHDALQELELKKNPATPHDLRRTVASHMAAMGIGDDVVARVLKHASEIGKTITGSVYIRHPAGARAEATVLAVRDAFPPDFIFPSGVPEGSQPDETM